VAPPNLRRGTETRRRWPVPPAPETNAQRPALQTGSSPVPPHHRTPAATISAVAGRRARKTEWWWTHHVLVQPGRKVFTEWDRVAFPINPFWHVSLKAERWWRWWLRCWSAPRFEGARWQGCLQWGGCRLASLLLYKIAGHGL
jgi:hypothetical protein